MAVIPENVFLIQINKAIAYMSIDNYVQWATKGPGERFYINRKSAGYISISSKNVTVLAQNFHIHEL